MPEFLHGRCFAFVFMLYPSCHSICGFHRTKYMKWIKTQLWFSSSNRQQFSQNQQHQHTPLTHFTLDGCAFYKLFLISRRVTVHTKCYDSYDSCMSNGSSHTRKFCHCNSARHKISAKLMTKPNFIPKKRKRFSFGLFCFFFFSFCCRDGKLHSKVE